MIKEIKQCCDVIIKLFNKELVMTKENKENFKNTSTCWICKNDCVDSYVKVRDNSHMTEKYRGSLHINFNINLKLSQKNSVVFHNLKGYGSHFIM